MILILTVPVDPHADRVERKLRERKLDVFRFDPARFPAEAALSLHYDPRGTASVTLRVDGTRIDLGATTTAWYRRPRRPVAHLEIADVVARTFVEEESTTVVQDAWASLPIAWMPAPRHVLRWAQRKATQLRIAGQLDFELPPTLISNDPADVLAFYQQHNGQVVSKLAGFTHVPEIDRAFARYTEVISTRDIGYADGIRFCPMIFQAYVPKRVELRVTVVGTDVFTAEIASQATHHTRHDWRHYDPTATPISQHVLPLDVTERCIELVGHLGLRYGAIDLVLTPDGRYVFLEINPNGQYLWIEDATGLPISDAICDLLASDLTPKLPVTGGWASGLSVGVVRWTDPCPRS